MYRERGWRDGDPPAHSEAKYATNIMERLVWDISPKFTTPAI